MKFLNERFISHKKLISMFPKLERGLFARLTTNNYIVECEGGDVLIARKIRFFAVPLYFVLSVFFNGIGSTLSSLRSGLVVELNTLSEIDNIVFRAYLGIN